MKENIFMNFKTLKKETSSSYEQCVWELDAQEILDMNYQMGLIVMKRSLNKALECVADIPEDKPLSLIVKTNLTEDDVLEDFIMSFIITELSTGVRDREKIFGTQLIEDAKFVNITHSSFMDAINNQLAHDIINIEIFDVNNNSLLKLIGDDSSPRELTEHE